MSAPSSSGGGSSWPPTLKSFVARALSSATPSNKAAVNDEMKKIIFTAHRDGTLHARDWASMDPFVVLDSLRVQQMRASQPVVMSAPPPQPPRVMPYGNGKAGAGGYGKPYTAPMGGMGLPTAFGSKTGGGIGYGVGVGTGTGAGTGTGSNGVNPAAAASSSKRKKDQQTSPLSKKKKLKNKSSSAALAFPTGYSFASTEEDEAKAKRAARFQREQEVMTATESSGPMFVPRVAHQHPGGGALGVTDHVEHDGVVNLSQMNGGSGGKGGWLGSRMGLEEPEPDANVINWDKYTIVGTNMKLEKRYLRLTSEPNPADIRPLPVLKQTLELLKRKWKETQDYTYVCDQFKSLRQDLTVQRIKNEFTVSVYEIHARMALEAADLGEYNQCQSMLRQLYEHNIAGHPDEFMAYRILYMLHTRNTGELGRIISHLAPGEKTAPAVKHALAVASSIATGNYHRFFVLFVNAPNMGGYIMDHFVERERIIALTKMSKTYMTLPLTFLTSELAFESIQHAYKFLEAHDAAVWHQPAQSMYPDLKTAHAVHSKATKRQQPKKAQLLDELVWDCKAASAACERGIQRYKTIDLKGQI